VAERARDGSRMDLSEINGIGPVRARWLEATFGVRNARDLATLSPDDIERRLKAEGRSTVSRATIESWLADARRHASQAKRGGTTRKPTRPGKKSAVERPVEWRPVASFVLEFQSRAGGAEERWRTAGHYVEQDLDQTWPGLDCVALCGWITHHLETSTGPHVIESAERPDARIVAASSETRGANHEAAEGSRDLLLEDRFEVYAVDGDGVEGAHLVRIDKPWWIEFSWSLRTPLPMEERGEWWLDVLLTSVGRGAPLRLRDGPVHLPANRPLTPSGYRYRYNVDMGVVTADHLETVYRASATVMFLSWDEARASNARFIDLGPLRFYQPPGTIPLGSSSVAARMPQAPPPSSKGSIGPGSHGLT
jgi:hypothetical protein